MTAYKVFFLSSARKDLQKLESRLAGRILTSIEALAAEPRPSGCTKLRGSSDLWRVRVGDHRVVYRVIDRVSEIETALADLIAKSPASYRKHDRGSLVFAGPDYRFDKPSEIQQRDQLVLRQRYVAWFERMSMLCAEPPEAVAEKLREANRELLDWIELGRRFEITSDQEANSRASRKPCSAFRELFALLPESRWLRRTGSTVRLPSRLPWYLLRKETAGSYESYVDLVPGGGRTVELRWRD